LTVIEYAAAVFTILKAFATYAYVAILGLLTGSAAWRCGPELAERIAVSDSRWVVITEAYSCSAVDPGKLVIFAEDLGSHERVNLLELNAEDDTHVEDLGSRRIQISLSNLVDIKSQAFAFGPYEVTYRYLPFDDPDTRRRYQELVKNPQDPALNKWLDDYFAGKSRPDIPRAPD
jgi:hypothetical protein